MSINRRCSLEYWRRCSFCPLSQELKLTGKAVASQTRDFSAMLDNIRQISFSCREYTAVMVRTYRGNTCFMAIVSV